MPLLGSAPQKWSYMRRAVRKREHESLELIEGPFEHGVLVAGVLQFNHGQGQSIDEQYDAGAAIVALLD